MANERDPRRGKLRDLRRMDAGRLSGIFLKCHPEHDWRNFRFPLGTPWGDRQLRWRESDRAEDEWVIRAVGPNRSRYSCGAPPAWFRRELSRKARRQAKQTMREQLRDGEEVTNPRLHRDVRWEWW